MPDFLLPPLENALSHIRHFPNPQPTNYYHTIYYKDHLLKSLPIFFHLLSTHKYYQVQLPTKISDTFLY